MHERAGESIGLPETPCQLSRPLRERQASAANRDRVQCIEHESLVLERRVFEDGLVLFRAPAVEVDPETIEERA